MTPTKSDRDLLFKKFGRAFFKQDLDAMYEVVTDDFTYSILVNRRHKDDANKRSGRGFFPRA